jgi:crossover junction endodeoxyribonuclease RuvC
MNIIAFDPGLNGSAAVLSREGLVVADDLPTIGDAKQRRIDAANLADLIREHGPYRLAIVEQVSAMPGNGAASMFRFGESFGTILGILGAIAIPVRLVTPTQWKKQMRLDSSAETSRARAIETWPHHAGLFARKKDHNRAEAALLALWGLRHGGDYE